MATRANSRHKKQLPQDCTQAGSLSVSTFWVIAGPKWSDLLLSNYYLEWKWSDSVSHGNLCETLRQRYSLIKTQSTCIHVCQVIDWSFSFLPSLVLSVYWEDFNICHETDVVICIWCEFKTWAFQFVWCLILCSLPACVSSVVTWLPKISTSCCRPGASERWRTWIMNSPEKYNDNNSV